MRIKGTYTCKVLRTVLEHIIAKLFDNIVKTERHMYVHMQKIIKLYSLVHFTHITVHILYLNKRGKQTKTKKFRKKEIIFLSYKETKEACNDSH